MAKHKKTLPVLDKTYEPGLVTTAPIVNNVGYTTFKNFVVNVFGKLEKRKGWAVLIGYGNSNVYNGCNIIPTYFADQIPTNTSPWDMPGERMALHARIVPTEENGVLYNDLHIIRAQRGYLPEDALGSYRFSNAPMLIKDVLRYNGSAWVLQRSKVISPPMVTTLNNAPVSNGLLPNGNVKFVDAEGYTYIFDGWCDSDTCNAVMSYKWDPYYKKLPKNDPNNWQVPDADTVTNVSVGREVPHKAILINVPTNTGIGPSRNNPAQLSMTYFYKVLPVYATGAVGAMSDPTLNAWIERASDLQPFHSRVVIYASSNPQSQAVQIQVPFMYDPSIIGFRVYRTKALVDDTIKPFPDKDTKFYFVTQIDRMEEYNNNTSNWVQLVPSSASKLHTNATDALTDDELGEELTADDTINSIRCLGGAIDNPANNNLLSVYENIPRYNLSDPYLSERLNMRPITNKDILKYGSPMRGTTGAYANGTLLVGGNPEYPAYVYVSDPNAHNVFRASRILNIPLASSGNMIKDMAVLGNFVYVFLQKGIYKLVPSIGSDVPYFVDLIDESIGVDDTNSVAVCNNVAMWIYNKTIYIMALGGKPTPLPNISDEIRAKTNNPGCRYVLSTMPAENSIRISVPVDYDAYNVLYKSYVYNLNKKVLSEEEANKSVMLRTNNVNEVSVGASVPALTPILSVSSSMPGLELGLSSAGGVMVRGDHGSGDADQYGLINSYSGFTTVGDPATMTVQHPISSELEKPLYFDTKLILNSLVLYGTGEITISINPDERGYLEDRTITLSEQGTSVMYNQHCAFVRIRIKHTAYSNIDLEKLEVKVTPISNNNIKNDTVGG